MADTAATARDPGGTRPSGSPLLSVIVPCYNERPNVAPMIDKLHAALAGIDWEVIYVDDNSPDGTANTVRDIARRDPRVRCIRRVGRRGLASAVIEGALSSSADYVAVIDGDLQHDETRLPVMLESLRTGDHDMAVASRHVDGRRRCGPGAAMAASAVGWRHPAGPGLPAGEADRPDERLLHAAAPAVRGSGEGPERTGLQDPAGRRAEQPRPLRVKEIPAGFRERVAGESKLDALVMMQFAGLLLDKVFGGMLPLRFFSFALVGALGVVVHMAVLIGCCGCCRR